VEKLSDAPQFTNRAKAHLIIKIMKNSQIEALKGLQSQISCFFETDSIESIVAHLNQINVDLLKIEVGEKSGYVQQEVIEKIEKNNSIADYLMNIERHYRVCETAKINGLRQINGISNL
jgi:hypothetical protein